MRDSSHGGHGGDDRHFNHWGGTRRADNGLPIFFKTYTEKVWGMDCDEISADWAAQRIKGLNFYGALTDALRRSLGFERRPCNQAKTLIESFRYPRRGPGMMWEAAARKIRRFGGRIFMDRRCEKLTFDPEQELWTVEARSSDGTVETFQARHVVSSAPIRELFSALNPTPLTLFHARALKYRDFLTVVLIGRPEMRMARQLDLHP